MARSWDAAQARAMLRWGHTPGEIARILRVHPSQVSRWLRASNVKTSKPLRPPEGKMSIPAVAERQIRTDPKPKTQRGFIGAHYWHWTARIAEVGRDLILPNRRELSHTYVWSGPWEASGFPVRLEMHRRRNWRLGEHPGSLVVRFSMPSRPGETPYELRDRATQAVQDVLSSVARERRLKFESVRLSAKPHYEGSGEALAGLAGRDFRVTTQDAYGKVWIDWSRPGTREANTAESLAAYLRVDGNLQATLEELRGLRGEMRVMEAATGAIRELADEIRGVKGPQSPKGPAPAGPEVG